MQNGAGGDVALALEEHVIIYSEAANGKELNRHKRIQYRISSRNTAAAAPTGRLPVHTPATLQVGTIAQPRQCRIVLTNASTFPKHEAQEAVRACMPLRLCRCKSVQSHSLGIVLRNTPSCIGALSHNKLPEASARAALCLASASGRGYGETQT